MTNAEIRIGDTVQVVSEHNAFGQVQAFYDYIELSYFDQDEELVNVRAPGLLVEMTWFGSGEADFPMYVHTANCKKVIANA